MGFYIYDIIFLVIFTLLVVLFLHKNKKNLQRDMKIAFLYKSQWGVKLINIIGSKYKRTLNVLQYFVIATGYILMISVVYLIGKSTIFYVFHAKEITSIIKAPPIAPVIPYFPELFGLKSFFPPFYFTYFIVSLMIVAVFHEFSHGVFMKFHKVRIKSTGFLFLGPLLGAFVEQDERDMQKATKKAQLSILGAGVFANIVLAIIFYLLWIGVFYMTFIPTGMTFNSYTTGVIKISSIDQIGGINVSNITNQDLIDLIKEDEFAIDLVLVVDDKETEFSRVIVNEESYYMSPEIVAKNLHNNSEYLELYFDFPAINAGLKGTIIEVNGEEIKDYEDLVNMLDNKKPGDELSIKTNYNGELIEKEIILVGSPLDPNKGIIGISNGINIEQNMAEVFAGLFKKPFTEYKIRNEFLGFIYYMIFWIFLINLLVGLFNMLPVSILDGGRFFYLTVWAITKNEQLAKNVYKWLGIIILSSLILIMIAWVFGSYLNKFT